VLRAAGAEIVDPADLPSLLAAGPENLESWPVCSGPGDAKGRDDDCSVVLKYGMKRDFAAWLASLGAAAPVKSLTELRAWNRAHAREGTLRYGQSQLDNSDEMDVNGDRERYERDRARDVRLAGTNGIDAAITTYRLDALIFPGPTGAAAAAKPGYPTVIVPFATVPNLLAPPGFDARPTPFGVSFTGTACSEPRLIELAYAFEQATKRRRPPALD
jgi:amidase